MASPRRRRNNNPQSPLPQSSSQQPPQSPPPPPSYDMPPPPPPPSGMPFHAAERMQRILRGVPLVELALAANVSGQTWLDFEAGFVFPTLEMYRAAVQRFPVLSSYPPPGPAQPVPLPTHPAVQAEWRRMGPGLAVVGEFGAIGRRMRQLVKKFARCCREHGYDDEDQARLLP